MKQCIVQDKMWSEHKWHEGKYDGQSVQFCARCGQRQREDIAVQSQAGAE